MQTEADAPTALSEPLDLPLVHITLHLFDSSAAPKVLGDTTQGGDLVLTAEFGTWRQQFTLVGPRAQLMAFLHELLATARGTA